MNRTRPSAARRAFTLVEVIVVIVIASILMLIAVPSFSAMLRSTEASLAENLLRAAMRGARDLALQNEGRDAAAVFFFEPGGRLTIVPCVRVGELNDSDNPDTEPRFREVFAPAPGYSPVQLPKGWMVRGLAPPKTLGDRDPDRQWYDNSSARYDPDEANWVFPETGFYNYARADEGAHRQTFMVRFKGGTGMMTTGVGAPGLVVSVRPSGEDRDGPYRIDQAEDLGAFVTRVLRDPALDLDDKRELLGDESSDTVLARPLGQIALYDEGRMAADMGLRVDPKSGCMYKPPRHLEASSARRADEPAYIDALHELDVDARDAVFLWMIGDTDLSGRVLPSDPDSGDVDEPQAKVFALDRYTGALRQVEVQP